MTKRGRPIKYPAESLIGLDFGRLHVVELAEKTNCVVCDCQCGTKTIVRVGDLTKQRKPTRSCGCLQRESARQAITEYRRVHKQPLKMFHTNFDSIENLTPPKNNTTGRRGVSFNKHVGKYCAYLNVQKKRIHLGWSDTFEGAVEMRKAGEEKYYTPLINAKNSGSVEPVILFPENKKEKEN